ncbi:hypothetical protein [Bacillus taeanensis]|nr:hypothetical protein [Bacillus taeanensis]
MEKRIDLSNQTKDDIIDLFDEQTLKLEEVLEEGKKYKLEIKIEEL